MSGYMTGMGTSPGMWELLSDILEGEKLPESLNSAIYALRDGSAVVIPKELAGQILEALNGWNGPVHFALASHMRGNREPPNAELCGARRASEPTPGYAGDNNGE